MANSLMEKIVSLAKRRGFVYLSSEIYGGIRGFYDYGPLGVELKNNIKKEWWRSMVYDRDDVVGIDAAIIMNPIVWEKSGHLEFFTDPLVECKVCHKRFRKDEFEEFFKHVPKGVGTAAPKFGTEMFFCSDGKKHKFENLTKPRVFNLLTEVYLGVTEPKEKAYLRGEITQGVFVNFKNIINSTSVKIPFGIAQIGKAFRNEITPGNFTYRTREFEQMELEFFIEPKDKEAEKWFKYWEKQRMAWYVGLGMRKENLRFRKHGPEELAHYCKVAEDIEYKAPFGWSEFEGIHDRGNWDLSRHRLTYLDEEKKKEYTPWVVETSGGVDRSALFFLIDAYHEEKDRVILRFHPKLAPYKVAVFPLLANKPKLVKKARQIHKELKIQFPIAWDDRGNIGKRYYAQDEIGTLLGCTIDFQTLKDQTVTLRNRDTMKQIRVKISELKEVIQKNLEGEEFLKLGKPVK